MKRQLKKIEIVYEYVPDQRSEDLLKETFFTIFDEIQDLIKYEYNLPLIQEDNCLSG